MVNNICGNICGKVAFSFYCNVEYCLEGNKKELSKQSSWMSRPYRPVILLENNSDSNRLIKAQESLIKAQEKILKECKGKCVNNVDGKMVICKQISK